MFLQQKDPYTVQHINKESDFKSASAFLTQTEQLSIDIDLFKETKIAKVVKHLSKKGIEEENISERCRVLTETWIQQLQGIQG